MPFGKNKGAAGGGGGGGSNGVHWQSVAGPISEDINFILVVANDVEFTLDSVYGNPIMIDLVVDGRNPKIVTGDGITINGNTENLILEGGQGDEYVLVYDGQGGGNYILIAQGDAAFSFEGLVSGSVLAVSLTGGGATGGVYFSSNGTHLATQAGTTGAGIGYTQTVTITGNEVSSLGVIDSAGSAYNVGDLITLAIAGTNAIIPAVVRVTSVS